MTIRSVASIIVEIDAADAECLDQLITALREDGRPGVRRALARAERRRDAESAEGLRLERLAGLERELIDGGKLIVAGVDEVGRGALAGPVTACACVFDRDTMIVGINDSKKLSPAARERLASEIRASARGLAVAHVHSGEVDRLGIAGATVEAMRQALGALPERPEHVLVDGLPVHLGYPCTAIVSGDASTRAIGAASIVAKVARDRIMVELDASYPGYGFTGNKGYGSAEHIQALRSLGPSPVHRMSFTPCSSLSLF